MNLTGHNGKTTTWTGWSGRTAHVLVVARLAQSVRAVQDHNDACDLGELLLTDHALFVFLFFLILFIERIEL